MNLNSAFRALALAAVLAGAATAARAQPANTGTGSVPSEFLPSQSMAVTRGSAVVPRNGIAENNSDDAQATGNPLAVPAPTAQRTAGPYGTRAGNGASALGGFGTDNRG